MIAIRNIWSHINGDFILVMVVTLVMFSCSENCPFPINNETSPSSEVVNLIINGDEPGFCKDSIPKEGLLYQKYGWFDFKSVCGVGPVIDTPFVYVRKTEKTIVVRPSNDIEHPYVFTDHDKFWHCRWHSDSRGDSVVVDRFVFHVFVFEYIQRLKSDGKIYTTLYEVNYHNPLFSSSGDILDFCKFDLGVSDEFDRQTWLHFDEILAKKDSISVAYKNKKAPTNGTSRRIYTMVIRRPKHFKNPTYMIEGEIGYSHYHSAPLGIYDDFLDCQRISALKRI